MGRLYLGTKEVTPVISSGTGIPREVRLDGTYSQPNGTSVYFKLPSTAKDVSTYCLYYAFYSSAGILGADLSSLEHISNRSGAAFAFFNASNLRWANLSNLQDISGAQGANGLCQGCASVENIDFSSLRTVTGAGGLSACARDCRTLKQQSFPMLSDISGNGCLSVAFLGSTALENVYFPALTTTSFGTYTNQFQNMLSSTGTTVTHTLHFPSNLEAKIQTLSGYPNFGGTNGYVVLAYDLPATS